MRMRQSFVPTLRTVGDASMASHRLLLQAGYIRQIAAGIYAYLPLAQRVLRSISEVIREEMDEIGGQELGLPVLHPASLWQETGRYEAYGPELMRYTDRHHRPFVLGPTHEEIITSLVRDAVSSYKRLPLLLYQLQTKFRDEARPRSGLLRGREFWMKDAYSFHADADSLLVTYNDVLSAYQRMFSRCCLDVRVVEADAGSIGGNQTHEFLVPSTAGEDSMVICSQCAYAANIEQASVKPIVPEEGEGDRSPSPLPPRDSFPTPGCQTIEDLSRWLKMPTCRLVKSLLFMADDKPVLAVLRGDRSLNPLKLQKHCQSNTCEMVDKATLQSLVGVSPGSIGPVGLPENISIVIDQELLAFPSWIVGANVEGVHFCFVYVGRDLPAGRYEVADLRMVEEGDACPQCGNPLQLERGIEIGHIFQLETRYSEPMQATFLDVEGKKRPFWMGCYGIGVSRLLAAVVEQHHDEKGICWPPPIAPYRIHIVVVNSRQEIQADLGETIYAGLRERGISALLDDRWERAGVKFNDADLLGMPLQIVIGSGAKDGKIEYKIRRTGERGEIAWGDLWDQFPLLEKKALPVG
ncbi:proline--tRNA ligase [Pasteuria penetrans]|uniref:proline--tRNA ligase n=1 Tax=Pasteuria penetrans TaxID=86005 RepID=UPI000FA50E0B|nr:proline--tRNA ligase [Pasteuria penetrans]